MIEFFEYLLKIFNLFNTLSIINIYQPFLLMSKILHCQFKVPRQNFLPSPSLGGHHAKNINSNRTPALSIFHKIAPLSNLFCLSNFFFQGWKKKLSGTEKISDSKRIWCMVQSRTFQILVHAIQILPYQQN